MADLMTAAEMRAAETAAIAAGGATGAGLMARAGAAVAAAAGQGPGRAVVLCGPGANGGDGWVVARLLAQAGWSVSAHGWGDPDRAPPVAAAARRDWVRIGPVRDFAALPAAGPADLLVDAVLGTGATRPLPDDVLGPWRAFEAAGGARRRIAVDCPSGLDLDTGRALGDVRPADLTVAFHAPKRGHYLAEGPGLCGRLLVADIGMTGFGTAAARLGAHAPARLAKASGAHKYDHGHALVLAGGVGRGGAARLAARAALRVGAGLATVGAPGAALIENAARLDAVMLRRIDDAAGLAGFLGDPRVTAVLLGPGLGVGARTAALAAAALAAGRAVALDADALTSLAADPPWPLDPARVVLTPHGGEFARLFPDLAEAAARGDRIAAAVAAAERAGACVLLKGPDTVIAAPGRRPVVCAAVYDRAAPWLATAGSGDVLAGLVVGLLARGLPAPEAAEAAALLHQDAGRALGAGLIAEDLPDAIPAVLRALGL